MSSQCFPVTRTHLRTYNKKHPLKPPPQNTPRHSKPPQSPITIHSTSDSDSDWVDDSFPARQLNKVHSKSAPNHKPPIRLKSSRSDPSSVDDVLAHPQNSPKSSRFPNSHAPSNHTPTSAKRPDSDHKTYPPSIEFDLAPRASRPQLVYRRRPLVINISDTDDPDDSPDESHLHLHQEPPSTDQSTSSDLIPPKNIQNQPTKVTVRRRPNRSPAIQIQRRRAFPSKSAMRQITPLESSSSPLPKTTILRETTNFVRPVVRSPRIIIPRISSLKSKPSSQVPPAHKSSLAYPAEININGQLVVPSPPVPRKIRGRMSLVTSSARRNRIRPYSLIPAQRPTNHSPLPPASNPSTYDTPTRPSLPSHLANKPHKLVYHSPLARPQPPASPYAALSIALPTPSELSSLLKVCNQRRIHNFTTAVDNMSTHVKSVSSSTGSFKGLGRWTKIGEATYSEVFSWSATSIGGAGPSRACLKSRTVMKVIPIKRSQKLVKRQTTTSITNVNEDELVMDGKQDANEFPLETEWLDAEKEVKMAKLLGSASKEGFIEFRGCLVVSGAYPRVLLKEWDEYRRRYPKQAENPRPSKFSSKQLYCCLLFAHAGKDLEASTLNSWQEAASVLSQVTRALSWAEADYQFEHRDLHWGNLLIQPWAQLQEPGPSRETGSKAGTKELDELSRLLTQTALSSASVEAGALAPSVSGIAVSIIDYGLSRATVVAQQAGRKSGRRAGETIWTEPDAEIFGAASAGADYQFECYDLMRASRQGKPWSEFEPMSNVIWLHYLCRKLLEEKGIPKPVSERPTRHKAVGERATSNGGVLERDCYALIGAAERVLRAAVMGGCKPVKQPAARASRRRTAAGRKSVVDEQLEGVKSSGIKISSAREFEEWWKSHQPGEASKHLE